MRQKSFLVLMLMARVKNQNSRAAGVALNKSCIKRVLCVMQRERLDDVHSPLFADTHSKPSGNFYSRFIHFAEQ
jgi:hypothetical protein